MMDNTRKRKATWPTPTYGETFKSKGTIRFVMEKFAEFANSPVGTQNYNDAPVFIRGLPWTLGVEIEKEDEEAATTLMGFYVYCNKDEKKSWSCTAEVEMRVLAQKDGKISMSTSFGPKLFATKENKQGLHMETIERIMDPENGWFCPESDTVIVEAKISAGFPRNANTFRISDQEIERMEMTHNRMMNLLTSGKAADVHFLVGTGHKTEKFAAHKLILLSESEVFAKQFNYNEEQNRDPNEPIKVPDVTGEAFNLLLHYIYCGDLSGLNWANFFAVFLAAKKYKVSGLIQACTDSLDHLGLTNENVLSVLDQAWLHNENALGGRCWTHIDQNIYGVISSQKLLEIDQKLLAKLFGRDSLVMSGKPEGEIALWDAAIRWADEKCRQNGLEILAENRRKMLGSALYKIRFPLMTQEDLAEKIAPSSVLTPEELSAVASFRTFGYKVKYELKFPTAKRA